MDVGAVTRDACLESSNGWIRRTVAKGWVSGIHPGIPELGPSMGPRPEGLFRRRASRAVVHPRGDGGDAGAVRPLEVDRVRSRSTSPPYKGRRGEGSPIERRFAQHFHVQRPTSKAEKKRRGGRPRGVVRGFASMNPTSLSTCLRARHFPNAHPQERRGRRRTSSRRPSCDGDSLMTRNLFVNRARRDGRRSSRAPLLEQPARLVHP